MSHFHDLSLRLLTSSVATKVHLATLALYLDPSQLPPSTPRQDLAFTVYCSTQVSYTGRPSTGTMPLRPCTTPATCSFAHDIHDRAGPCNASECYAYYSSYVYKTKQHQLNNVQVHVSMFPHYPSKPPHTYITPPPTPTSSHLAVDLN